MSDSKKIFKIKPASSKKKIKLSNIYTTAILTKKIYVNTKNIGVNLINIFQEVNNVEVPYSFVKRREGDKAEIIADNTKILSTLNWEPKRSLKNMCIDGWKWHLMNPNGY